MLKIFLWHNLVELLLDLIGRLAKRQARTIRNPEDMRINGDGGLAEYRIENHSRGLATNSGQGFEM